MKTCRTAAVVALASCLAWGTTLRAASLAARMEVTATVPANCSLTVPPLSFGTYDPLTANSTKPADASAIVLVTCTRNTSASLTFDFGLHAPTGPDRAMAGPGSNALRYQIYRDSSRAEMWGEGSKGMRMLSKGISNPQELTVFGRIPPHQEVEPGTYNDVLTAAVDF